MVRIQLSFMHDIKCVYDSFAYFSQNAGISWLTATVKIIQTGKYSCHPVLSINT